MNGELVGEWRVDSRQEHTFCYASSWLSSPRSRPLSLSLPLRPELPYRGALVSNYFENLLPDSQIIRQRIQARFGARSNRSFDLLREIGRDCVGALQLLPEDEVPAGVEEVDAEPLSEGNIEDLLRITLGERLNSQEEFRISLAGAQEKTALLYHQGVWKRPRGSTPTSHIFKLPMGSLLHGLDLSTSVENEWLCQQVLRAFRIPVAGCEMARFGRQRVLIVERFDRNPCCPEIRERGGARYQGHPRFVAGVIGAKNWTA